MPDATQLIMIVDDNLANLTVGKSALAGNYTVLTVPSATRMLELLERYHPALILLDVEMPGMDGYEAIRILKARPDTRDTPVIFLTALSDSANELEGLSLGALDYITKPFSPPLLLKRVEMHLLLESQKLTLQKYNDSLQEMVQLKTQSVLKLQNKLITGMANLVEGRDNTTGGHIERTQHYLAILLTAILDDDLWAEETASWDGPLLLQSSQLHDVGKIAINDAILNKPGKLTPEEFEIMKTHVMHGVHFIDRLEDDDEDSHFLRYARTFIAYHHEKWDGSGYPYGLAGEAIPLLGRLMAIADVYDALTSVRPYKKAFSHEEAAAIIRDGAGSHFDPTLIRLFEGVGEQFRLIHSPASRTG
ncbi:MAG: response regulator [Zoogloeaceae bacterium]|jgi:putative two-component system response regulator|nr:response regulator [Zoogloeaceae bacterium]